MELREKHLNEEPIHKRPLHEELYFPEFKTPRQLGDVETFEIYILAEIVGRKYTPEQAKLN